MYCSSVPLGLHGLETMSYNYHIFYQFLLLRDIDAALQNLNNLSISQNRLVPGHNLQALINDYKFECVTSINQRLKEPVSSAVHGFRHLFDQVVILEA